MGGSLSDYKLLSSDCTGTLIDGEAAVARAFRQ